MKLRLLSMAGFVALTSAFVVAGCGDDDTVDVGTGGGGASGSSSAGKGGAAGHGGTSTAGHGGTTGTAGDGTGGEPVEEGGSGGSVAGSSSGGKGGSGGAAAGSGGKGGAGGASAGAGGSGAGAGGASAGTGGSGAGAGGASAGTGGSGAGAGGASGSGGSGGTAGSGGSSGTAGSGGKGGAGGASGSGGSGGTAGSGGSGGACTAVYAGTLLYNFDSSTTLPSGWSASPDYKTTDMKSPLTTPTTAYSATQKNQCAGSVQGVFPFTSYSLFTSAGAQEGAWLAYVAPTVLDWTGKTKLHAWYKIENTTGLDHISFVQFFASQDSGTNYTYTDVTTAWYDNGWHEVVLDLGSALVKNQVKTFGLQINLKTPAAAGTAPIKTTTAYLDDIWLE